jgi:RING finger/CHY zinc finger protein 1
VAPCCGEVHWCRHCHNEEKAHEVDRTAIKEMVCQHCDTRQPSAQDCRVCFKRMGEYFCDQCNFWDDQGEEKEVFHCDKCGICRVGGRENYFHCDTCDSCYPVAIRDSHRCVENAMHNDCPVCLQGLFHSTSEVSVLHCGHTIHAACLSQLLASGGLPSMRCPICSMSFCIQGMWDEVDRQVSSTPMPDEYRVPVEVLCNDCQEVSICEFHVLGLKCAECSSYNTRRI